MLNLTTDIRPISYIKAHTAEMLKQVDEKRAPIVITQNGEAKAVLLDQRIEVLLEGRCMAVRSQIPAPPVSAGATRVP